MGRGTEMTPETIAKANTEWAHQTAFFAWCSTAEDERLKFCFHVPNGGLRDKITAGRLKACGAKAGVPDVCVPIPCGQYHGLYIEFKKPGEETKKNGGKSDDQVKWQKFLQSQNYGYFVAYNYLQAIEVVLQYLWQS